eukprot:TRINITY_DN7188_c0_g1_i2.p1 TRINITY_DN7188_c0_g1~~TRINITY_DN7188_c0_g1_i2.p1  ORF type:complete len:720 (-),score=98.82 TRINITY_DN7188_c0_g1_i2:192-2351(-)
MGRGRCGSSEVEDKDEVDYDPSHKGPNKSRSCTDVICLLLLVVFCVIWGGVAVYAFSRGNPFQLIYPSNSEGEICGRGDHEGKPNLLFFDLTRCVKLSAAVAGCPTPQVCVKECPDTYWTYALGKAEGLENFCTDLSPGEFDHQTTNVSTLVKQRKCPAYLLPSTPFLGRCVPTFGLVRTGSDEQETNSRMVRSMKTEDGEELNSDSLKGGIEYLMKVIDLRGYGEKFLSDFAIYWWIVLLALVLAMVLSFGWIVLMRLAAKPVVWTSIVLCMALLVAATVFSFMKYAELRAAGENAGLDDIFLPPVISNLSSYYYNKTTWLVLGIILASLTVIILLVLIFLFTRIQIAIELLEEASKAVGSMMSVLFFPMGPFLFQGLVILWFAIVASFLATSGNKEYKVVDAASAETCINPATGTMFATNDLCDPATFPTDCITSTDGKTPMCVFHKFGPALSDSWLQIYNFFGLFWLLFFVEALGEMVMAGAFAGWYWTMDKDGDLENVGIFQSLKRTFRYHLGTLAFGSLILSFVRMLRVILEYVEGKLKEYGEDNPAVKCITCFCKCCLYCLEKFIRFLNRNAYIMTAVYGHSFCSGARRSFSLLAQSTVRALVLDKVTDFILFIGKLIVVGLVSAATFATFSSEVTSSLNLNLNYHFVPMLVIILGTYAIASTFFSVYSMAVDTIFLCFLEDIEKHDGSEENPYFMNQDLKKILELKEDKEEA